jgi:hypothetical protein
VRRRRFLAGLAAASSTAACGYSLQGRGITTDASVRRIGVPLFKDRTGKLGLDARVTAAVVNELLKRGRFTVVKETSGVDAVVEGELIAYTVQPVGFTATIGGQVNTQASRYAIALSAKVVYRKIGQLEPMWSNDAFSQRDEYDVGDSPQGFFDREEQSMDRLADAFAKSVVAAMLEAF